MSQGNYTFGRAEEWVTVNQLIGSGIFKSPEGIRAITDATNSEGTGANIITYDSAYTGSPEMIKQQPDQSINQVADKEPLTSLGLEPFRGPNWCNNFFASNLAWFCWSTDKGRARR